MAANNDLSARPERETGTQPPRAASAYESPRLTPLGRFSALTLQQSVGVMGCDLGDNRRLFGLIK